ncbi:MAG: undecaprenyl-phosphate glucose phosphotransferase [candidate division KSB1 bacterium]|nr:undecaprenyl-phosphate glucose phosphotransferase [candidate division KSB1 bacterium]
MPKRISRAVTFVVDFLAIHAAFLTWAAVRQEMGFFAGFGLGHRLLISSLIWLYWVSLLLFYGLYRGWHAQSRLDEFVALLKAISVGVGLIFVATLDLERDLQTPITLSRVLIVTYWALLILFVGTGRMALRTVQRKLLERGIGLRRTVVVGVNEKARELARRLGEFPALGYRVIGFVQTTPGPHKRQSVEEFPVLGHLRKLPQIIRQHQVEEIVVALEEDERRQLVEILDQCDGLPVGVKIQPDLYDIVLGQARTNQLYGVPLIEVMPRLMPPWEERIKRLMDIVVSLVVLVAGIPLWILVALAIKLDSPGPVLFKQKRVGKDGKIFTIYKFRSMIEGAEKMTGPKWAEEDDPRITRVGKILRKLRIDEFPQLINVLAGDMSLVGPRPERPYFVRRLKHQIPLYTRRLRVKPGITGWAQVKGHYDTSIEDVRKKLEYDLFYIENMSLRMDFKILLTTIYVALAGKGR